MTCVCREEGLLIRGGGGGGDGTTSGTLRPKSNHNLAYWFINFVELC